MNAPIDNLRLADVRRRFDRAAANFDGADYVHRQCFDELMDRLSPVVIEPKAILDLGSATGKGSRALAKSFRGARVLGLDLSSAMLALSRTKRSRFSKIREVRADARQIPVADNSVDLVFANMLLPWITELPACLAEVARILKKGGVFAFSTLGPDSLSLLRTAWHDIDGDGHVHAFTDMHIVGDALVGAGLADPVLDVDRLAVTFPDAGALYRDLAACGARNCLERRRRSLTGKTRFRAATERLLEQAGNGRLSIELELVYGHAWGRGPRSPEGEFRVDPGSIGRRR
jgi:malonyl-CoA O-methyltransferase